MDLHFWTKKPFIFELVSVLADQMEIFPEIKKQQNLVLSFEKRGFF
jgi:hypothetical protein